MIFFTLEDLMAEIAACTGLTCRIHGDYADYEGSDRTVDLVVPETEFLVVSLNVDRDPESRRWHVGHTVCSSGIEALLTDFSLDRSPGLLRLTFLSKQGESK